MYIPVQENLELCLHNFVVLCTLNTMFNCKWSIKQKLRTNLLSHHFHCEGYAYVCISVTLIWIHYFNDHVVSCTILLVPTPHYHSHVWIFLTTVYMSYHAVLHSHISLWREHLELHHLLSIVVGKTILERIEGWKQSWICQRRITLN